MIQGRRRTRHEDAFENAIDVYVQHLLVNTGESVGKAGRQDRFPA